MKETDGDASRERQIAKPGERSNSTPGLDLVLLSKPDDTSSRDKPAASLNTEARDNKRLAGVKPEDTVNHLDFSPDPYESVEMSKPLVSAQASDVSKSSDVSQPSDLSKPSDQPKSVDQRLAEGRKSMEDLAEKHMTQFYPSVFDGKQYQYAPTFKKDMEKLEGRMNSGQEYYVSCW